MRRFLFAAVLMMLISGVAVGQDFRKVEIFGGYSIFKVGISDSGLPAASILSSSFSKFMTRGANASVTYNANRYVGMVTDFRYNEGDIAKLTIDIGGEPVTGQIKLRDISVMVGPRFTLRKSEHVTPFAHALVGLDYVKYSGSVDLAGAVVDTVDNKGLGVAVGGGLDVNISDNVAIRLIQADYYLTRHESVGMNNMNLAFGLVIRFGR